MSSHIMAQLLAVDAGDGLKSRQAQTVAIELQETGSVEFQVPFHFREIGHKLPRFFKRNVKVLDSLLHGVALSVESNLIVVLRYCGITTVVVHFDDYSYKSLFIVLNFSKIYGFSNLYTFLETLPPKVYKHNSRVFDGKYITVTRKKDGRLQPNFKPIKEWKGFSAVNYAKGVANELLWALGSLLEKEVSE